MKFIFSFFLFLVFTITSYSQQNNAGITLDSIEYYIQKSKNRNIFSTNDRLGFALKAKRLSVNINIDSTILVSNKAVSELYWEIGLNNKFKKVNQESLEIAKRTKDTLSLAEFNFNLAELYRLKIRLTDSAFYYYHNAEKLYVKLDDKFNTSKTLLRIAIIQKNEKDYVGSEVTSISAISLLEALPEDDEVKQNKSFLYNNLGNVFEQLEQFEESINYYEKAIELKKDLKGNNRATINNSLNNLALVYKNSNQYSLASSIYKQILDDKNLINERPDFYALVLDNYAHTLYLSEGTKQLPELFLRALNISDSIKPNGYNSIIINQHLAEYYNDRHIKDSALFFAYRAKNISEKYHNDDLLKSLKLLSEIEEGDTAAHFLKDYIKLSDSLLKVERQTRNKFARIRFETNQIEQENIQIAKERMWLLIISVVVIMASFLLYLVITQRNKNKELQFIQKQQETNEEIYNLMLSQNEGIEEARTLEKKRISEELHDGVLGRLFGTRLSLDSLNFNNTPEAIKTRSQYIEELKNIEQDIRKVSHELNTDFVSGSGFIDIIKTLVETQTIAYKLNYNLKRDDAIHWDEITNKKKIHIYRIIQETLHNIYKHAQAAQVNISFKLKNNVICLTIVDDGSGFDVNKAKSGIGLKNINSRINEISGIIKITSEKEVGTTVIIEVPIP
ncbi:tetratricopeptide repeat protein [Seonamhaeicola maritimus]|uniref:ATP-binding protein n=1 Tax=Seonamhaeicola maritimus TaxID=2591822 RepID=UPI0024958253|nr:tetratricopeptide repeat-containing sensor histidine kinase [Seonamhaeicola maritimus]